MFNQRNFLGDNIGLLETDFLHFWVVFLCVMAHKLFMKLLLGGDFISRELKSNAGASRSLKHHFL